MNTSSDQASNISVKDQAIDWLVRLRDDQLGDDDLDAFAEWLDQSPERRKAFSDAEQLFKDMVMAAENLSPTGSLPPSQTKTAKVIPLPKQPSQSTSPHRRNVLAGLAAACLLAFGLAIPEQAHILSIFFSDYYTHTGELREIQLSDGSHLLLNTNSAVSVDFTANARQIVLHHGQVRFTVAQDTQRPFEVVTDNLKIRALGTIFEVYKNDHAETNVIVQEHAVTASVTGNSAGPAVINIRQGQQWHYQSGQQRLTQPEPAQLEQTTAWQQYRLLINDRSLIEVVKELERYRLGRIFVSDASLYSLRVSGVFALENPDNALATLRQVLALKETRIGPWWVVLHR